MRREDLLLNLFTFESDYLYLKVCLVLIILCKLTAIRQTTRLDLQFNRSNRLMKQFVERTNITHLVYRPYWVSITPLLQAITYTVCEAWLKCWQPERFDREEVTLDDGGTVGIDWACDSDSLTGRPLCDDSKNKPILLLAPGLGGGARNLYTMALVRAARRAGFKVGTMLFRNADGLPITSGKLSYSGSWQDCKAMIDYVHAKYVRVERQERLYAYGCSLGANILALYMIREGTRARQKLDGAFLYGTPWSAAKGAEFLYNNAFGVYQKVIGLALNEDIRKNQLPQMKPYMSESDYEHYKSVVSSNWSGLKPLDEHVFVKMFGYADTKAYYNAVTVAEHVMNIKVPTFALGANDDQIVGNHLAPFKSAQSRDSNICLGSTDYGAHVCHMTGHFLPKPWYT